MAKRYWSFFWRTKLTPERQEVLQTWVDSLTEEQYHNLQDIVADARNDAEWELNYSNDMK